MPSPATRTVPKMPAAIPARCTGTTLTDSPSIRPHGNAVPAPISISNGTHCEGDGCDAWRDSRYRPVAQTSKPSVHNRALPMRSAQRAASIGSTSIGADRASICNPTAAARCPCTPNNCSGSTTSSTT
ncbi:hypothetical protein G6F66_014884 [Rhizopus arrhizus]|nr:hypothetical protein G6F66_014884 [Rhizopus arrhizus]